MGGCEKEDEKYGTGCEDKIKYFAKLPGPPCMGGQSAGVSNLAIQESHAMSTNHLQSDSNVVFQTQKRHAMRINASRSPFIRILCCHIPIWFRSGVVLQIMFLGQEPCPFVKKLFSPPMF